jgi:HK97 family phage portal protein
MSVLRSIFERRTGDTFGTTPAGWLLNALGGSKTAAGQTVSPATAEGIPVVYACVSILAETVGQLPLKLYKTVPRGQEPATDHPLYAVLHDLPNPFMTAIEFREVMMRWLALWGNCYAEIERRPDGQPVGLWPLASDRMTMDRDARGHLRYTYALQSGGTQTWTVVDTNNPPIFHLHINSRDGFTGRSPITILRESLGITVAADRHAASFFGMGAMPDVVFSKKGPGKMSPAARQNFIESWKEKFQGSAKAHGIALLEEEFTVTPLTMPMKDAQFLELRSFQIEDGARIYRIPLFMLGHTTAVTSWGTGIESMSQGFVNFTMLPWLVRWEQAIARDMLSVKSFNSHFARFSVQALMRGDSAARGTFYGKLFESGALSPNDILALEEMNGIGPDGNKRFVSTNLQLLDAPVVKPAPAPVAPVVPDEPMAPEPDAEMSSEGDTGPTGNAAGAA